MRRSPLAFALLFGALGASAGGAPPADPGPARPYAGHSVVRAKVSSLREMRVLEAVGDVWTETPRADRPVDVMVTPAGRRALTEAGIAFEVWIEDVQAVVDAERAEIDRRRMQRDLAWFANYHPLAEIDAKLDAMSAAYPGLAQSAVVGPSLEGRTIRALRITGPGTPDNPKASRSALIFNGGQHAREWVSPATVMYIADRLLETYATDARTRRIVDHAEIIVVPVVNPDGYEYTWAGQRMWRKNRRDNGDGTSGVDLNRNWGYQWGGEGASTSTNSETYRGTGPFSEPETRVLRDFVLANPRLRGHIDFHSYSQLILSPFGYTPSPPPDSATFDQINARLQGAVLSVHGMYYEAGPVYTTIYPASGVSNDWTYGAGSTPRKILGWGWELRDTGQYGFVLPPDQIIPTGEENLEALKTLAEILAFPLTISFPQGVPVLITAGLPTDVSVTITPSPDETVMPGSERQFVSVNGGPYTPSALTPFGGNAYRATLPPGACGDQISWYIEAMSGGGATLRAPEGAPVAAYASDPAEKFAAFVDACESGAGWTVGAAGDAASTGIWENADPQSTAAQPADDHTPAGTRCWVTDGRAGSSVGTYDVDNGATTLTSPAFSGLPPANYIPRALYASYWRWYSNDQGGSAGTDSMPVRISNDDGATWTDLELVTQNAGAWVGVSRRVDTLLPAGGAMRLRFVARDLGDGSIVEAGVDDVSIDVFACPRHPADFNGDGFVTGDDFDGFVAAFESGDPSADFNGDGFVTGDDFDGFVSAFEGG